MRDSKSSGVCPRPAQRGAALVVRLVMLAIITLLAITAMNTSSTELIMAGNEQFRERAFQAAEAGIEQGVRDFPKVLQDGVEVKVSGVAIASLPDDTFSIASKFIGIEDDIPNYSEQFAGIHYRVISTGTSRRNSGSTQETGGYVVAGAAPGDTQWDPTGTTP